MDNESRVAELEQALRDERAERDAAQRRATDVSERVAVWRKRAEDRAIRIDRLESERDQLRSMTGWMRAKAGRTLAGSQTETPAVPTRTIPVDVERAVFPSIPVVRSALLTQNRNMIRVWAETDVVEVVDGAIPVDVDVAVVEASMLSADAEASIMEWAASTARQPLIVLDQQGTHPVSDAADLIISEEDVDTFDPLVHNPLVERHPKSDDVESAKAAQRQHRLAFKYRAPWILASRLLDEAGVVHSSPEYTVGGLLVSMRPDDLKQAIRMFDAQDHPEKELVVVCHGFDSSAVSSEIDQLNVPCTVLDAPSDMMLGRCLNMAAEHTSADVLAKIDDDDYYGPSYLTDAVNSMRYSEADIVGKAAQFTYVASADKTVLRRPDAEERFTTGSVAGGSLVFRRRIWEDVRFPIRPRRVDALFLRGARVLGASVYANSRWEFIYNRRTASQTWRASDDVFLSGVEDVWDGANPSNADA